LITRAFAYYAHKNDNIDLIINHDLKIILKDYINYNKKNNLPFDNNLEKNKEYDNIFKEKLLFSDNDLSDNYNILSDLNNKSDYSIEISLNIKHNDSDSSNNNDNNNILYNKKYLINLDLENIHNNLNNINKKTEFFLIIF
jgi:hypothetical protein